VDCQGEDMKDLTGRDGGICVVSQASWRRRLKRERSMEGRPSM
jgi:hypothetical protein